MLRTLVRPSDKKLAGVASETTVTQEIWFLQELGCADQYTTQWAYLSQQRHCGVRLRKQDLEHGPPCSNEFYGAEALARQPDSARRQGRVVTELRLPGGVEVRHPDDVRGLRSELALDRRV